MPRRRLTRRRLARWLRGRDGNAALLGLSADDRDELVRQAHHRIEAGDLDDADRLLDLLDALWPGRSALPRAVVRQARGDLAGADRLYGDALAADPGDPFALANRAEVRLLLGRPAGVVADLDAALARAPAALRDRIARLREIATEATERGAEPPLVAESPVC